MGHDPDPAKDVQRFTQEFEATAYGDRSGRGDASVDLTNWVFPEMLYVYEERFSSLDCSGAVFLKGVYFRETRIANNSRFTGARFVDDAIFRQCSLQAANFTNVVFEKDVLFDDDSTLIFGTFERATFSGRAGFDRVIAFACQ
jgi:uncharacterized protein YjbI with pentapeptide repeats